MLVFYVVWRWLRKRASIGSHFAKLASRRVQTVVIVALCLLVSTRTHEKVLRSDFTTPNSGSCRSVAFDPIERNAFAADISGATEIVVRRFNGSYYRKGRTHWWKLSTVVRAQTVGAVRFFPTVCVASAARVMEVSMKRKLDS
jgi:hypothetical protein